MRADLDDDGFWAERRAAEIAKGNHIRSINDSYGFDGNMTIMYPMHRKSTLASTVVYYVNGIWNDYVEALDSAQQITNLVGTEVKFVYSSNEGIDILIAVQIATSERKTAAARVLADNLKRDLKSNKKVIVIGHSRGAAVVQSALESLSLMEWQGNNLAILTLGGFCKLPEKWFVPKSTMILSYIQLNAETFDMVPMLRNELGDKFDLGDIFRGVRIPLSSPLKSWEFLWRIVGGRIHGIKNYYHAIESFMKMYLNNQRKKETVTLWTN